MSASGRLYTVGFAGVTLAAVQDLLAVYSGASHLLAIHNVSIGQITGTSVANFRLRLRYLPSVVTPGSGGTIPLLVPWTPGDAAPTATAHANDTTQASTNGTAINLWDDVWNSVSGYYWTPPIAGRPPIIGLGGAFVLSLDTAPASLVANGSVLVEELP